jgi:hypothetical protein
MALLAHDRSVPYREVREPPLDDGLRTLALECFALQRAVAASCGAAPAEGRVICAAAAEHPASSATLERILASGRRVAGIATEREIATAVPFNVRHVRDMVWSPAVAARRRRLDRELGSWLRTLFEAGAAPVLFPAGQWWYPPGSYLGWHTNERFPGWRLYLSHAETPGASFFRYRDPSSGAVVTSPDGAWDLRLFEVSTERRLWHAVASETHRFSIGWIVRPWSVRNAASLRVKRVLELLGARAEPRPKGV